VSQVFRAQLELKELSAQPGSQGTQGVQGITGIQGTQGVTGASGTSSSVFSYNASTTTTPPPSSGQIRWNNATQISATNLYISHLTSGNVDTDVLLSTHAINDIFFVQDANNLLIIKSGVLAAC
jgi:hypothetical protein